ncbi:glutathione S-transferase family protein [Pontitalea aquivivens]|uniref:glutathione S-transferase family protein n=1 Tax=Pontitalea aquivivens TaxID=3388663 RepID=UPI003970F7E3
MMILFHSPGSCSLGIRIILEEIGRPYETRVIDLKTGAQRQPDYLAQNPKGKVPALIRPDGSLLTEFPAIALWLARSAPAAGLLPEGLEPEVRALEFIDHIVASLHMRGATLAMLPQKFTTNAAAQDDIRAHGRAVLQAGYDVLAERVRGGGYMLGGYSIADAAAFYLLGWHDRAGLTLPPALTDYMARMAARPAVQRALA